MTSPSIFRDNMDKYERRALLLELEQRQRRELGGCHQDFWCNRYERMQLRIIQHYRKLSRTWPQPFPHS